MLASLFMLMIYDFTRNVLLLYSVSEPGITIFCISMSIIPVPRCAMFYIYSIVVSDDVSVRPRPTFSFHSSRHMEHEIPTPKANATQPPHIFIFTVHTHTHRAQHSAI